MDIFGIGSIIGSAISAATNIYTNEENQDFSAEEAAKQRAWSERMFQQESMFNRDERISAQDYNTFMWNATNEYNRPSAQMERLVSAGINPNNAAAAIAGGSSSPIPAASPTATASVPSGAAASAPSMLDVGAPFASMFSQAAQGKASLAQAKLSDSMADKTSAETAGILIDNSYKPFEKEADLDHAYAEIDLMLKQGELSVQQATNLRDSLDSVVGLNYAQINKLMADASVASAELGRVQEATKLLTEEIETERHKQSQLDAAAFEAYQSGEEHKSAISVNGTVMSLNEAEEALKDAHAEEQRLKNKWREHCQSLGYDSDSKHLDRLIDSAGSNIRLLQTYGNRLIDGVRQKAHSASNFFSGSVLPSLKGAAQDVYSGYKDVSEHGTKWSKIWNK